jgi:SAM-dependent methyltransferase
VLKLPSTLEYLKSIKSLVPQGMRPAARFLFSAAKGAARKVWPRSDYDDRKRGELAFFTQARQVDELPAIAQYWSNTYLAAMLRPFGFTNALECFRGYLLAQCQSSRFAHFLSIGSGSADAEINIAQWLQEQGVRSFKFECLDINEDLLERAQRSAQLHAVEDRFIFNSFDINAWRPRQKYDAVVALQSLHHVVNLESLFESIRDALTADGYFLSDDMIGRNGHQRWPEALKIVRSLWRELPDPFKFNQQLQRFEREYENWDCSKVGFEGVRSQDILPLLIRRFHFEIFIAFGNVIDVFIDRGFGHNFDPKREWDREFIDRVHMVDVSNLEQGIIKPTHMIAVMKKQPVERTRIHKHFSPEFCLR